MKADIVKFKIANKKAHTFKSTSTQSGQDFFLFKPSFDSNDGYKILSTKLEGSFEVVHGGRGGRLRERLLSISLIGLKPGAEKRQSIGEHGWK